uniref:Uncharacterized protein n=1 Tax=Chryseobacterium endophyticum TaxID=1854762 RepID=A0AAU6WKK7_9FLAO
MKNINNYLAKVLNVPLEKVNMCSLYYEAKKYIKTSFSYSTVKSADIFTL